MKKIKNYKVLIALFTVILCVAPAGFAGSIGTGFTYQGRLIDANEAADGLYDFQFKLFDDESAGNQLGQDVNLSDADVIDGYFTIEIDFGSGIFNGDALWLEIGIRPGILNDPNVYTFLDPRQKVTPNTYSLWSDRTGTIEVPLDVNSSSIKPTIKAATSMPASSGVYGRHLSSTGDGAGVVGDSGSNEGAGVHGHNASFGYGVLGTGDGYGVFGESRVGFAVYGRTLSGYAGYFDGNTVVTGDANVGGSLNVSGSLSVLGAVVGDITDINAGAGLSGGGTTGSIDIDVEVPLILYSAATSTGTISGYNTKSIGIYGEGASNGVKGYSLGGSAVFGISDEGIGLSGSTSSGYSWAAAVRGSAYSVATGVEGSSTGGIGVTGTGGGNKGHLGGSGFGVKSEGNVLVEDGDLVISTSTGAYRGNIGPNGGAPFPRPAYDSNWVPIAQSESKVLTHSIGGDINNYVVDLQCRDTDTSGASKRVNNINYGGNTNSTGSFGAHWSKLSSNIVVIERNDDDIWADEIRVRIWVYN